MRSVLALIFFFCLTSTIAIAGRTNSIIGPYPTVKPAVYKIKKTKLITSTESNSAKMMESKFGFDRIYQSIPCPRFIAAVNEVSTYYDLISTNNSPAAVFTDYRDLTYHFCFKSHYPKHSFW